MTTLALDELTYDLVLVGGRRLVALWPDGTVLPVVRGGEGPTGGDGGGQGGDGGTGAGGDGGQGGGTGDGSTGSGQGDGGDPSKKGGDGAVTMTQAELDALIEKRMAKAKKSWADEAKAEAERASMSEAERTKAELEDERKAKAEVTKQANTRLVRSEVKALALADGVTPDKVARFMRLVSDADIEGVDVDDDGAVDDAAAKKVVAALLGEFPEFKAKAPPKSGATGGEHGDNQPEKAKSLEDAVRARLAAATSN